MNDDINILKLLIDNIEYIITILVGGSVYTYTAKTGQKRVDAKTETILQGELYQQDQYSAAIALRKENEELRNAEIERLRVDIRQLEAELEALNNHVKKYKYEAIELRAELEKKEVELQQLRDLYDSLVRKNND